MCARAKLTLSNSLKTEFILFYSFIYLFIHFSFCNMAHWRGTITLLFCLFVCLLQYSFVCGCVLVWGVCVCLFLCLLTLVLRKGVVATPLWFFPDNFFGQPKIAKGLYVIYTNPITHLSQNFESKFGGALWVGGVVKVFGRGIWWNSMILILPKYLTRYMLVTWYVD